MSKVLCCDNEEEANILEFGAEDYDSSVSSEYRGLAEMLSVSSARNGVRMVKMSEI
jgi:hypothetical protein